MAASEADALLRHSASDSAAARAIAMVLRAGSFGGCGALMLETPNPTGALAVSAFLSSRAVADVLDERVGGADGRLALLALLGSAVASRATGRFAVLLASSLAGLGSRRKLLQRSLPRTANSRANASV